jgi:hypothetical protein
MPGPYQLEINKALAPVAAAVTAVSVFFLTAGFVQNPFLAAGFSGLIAFAIGYISAPIAAIIIVIGSVFLFWLFDTGINW